MKKVISLLVIFVLVLAVCGSSSDSDEMVTKITEPVEVEFWHAMTGGMEETLNKLVKDFNDSQDMVTVKAVNQGSYSDLDTKIQSAGSAGELPTMAQTYPNNIYEYEKMIGYKI